MALNGVFVWFASNRDAVAGPTDVSGDTDVIAE